MVPPSAASGVAAPARAWHCRRRGAAGGPIHFAAPGVERISPESDPAGTIAASAETNTDTDPERGLDEAEAQRRLERHGPNTIEETHRPVVLKLVSYFWGPIP
ncbi:MAG: cation-transporting P-type ATPase [Rhodospirillaceae bacterium]